MVQPEKSRKSEMKHQSLRIKYAEDQDENIALLSVDSLKIRRSVNFKLKYYLSIGLCFIALSFVISVYFFLDHAAYEW